MSMKGRIIQLDATVSAEPLRVRRALTSFGSCGRSRATKGHARRRCDATAIVPLDCRNGGVYLLEWRVTLSKLKLDLAELRWTSGGQVSASAENGAEGAMRGIQFALFERSACALPDFGLLAILS